MINWNHVVSGKSFFRLICSCSTTILYIYHIPNIHPWLLRMLLYWRKTWQQKNSFFGDCWWRWLTDWLTLGLETFKFLKHVHNLCNLPSVTSSILEKKYKTMTTHQSTHLKRQTKGRTSLVLIQLNTKPHSTTINPFLLFHTVQSIQFSQTDIYYNYYNLIDMLNIIHS